MTISCKQYVTRARERLHSSEGCQSWCWPLYGERGMALHCAKEVVCNHIKWNNIYRKKQHQHQKHSIQLNETNLTCSVIVNRQLIFFTWRHTRDHANTILWLYCMFRKLGHVICSKGTCRTNLNVEGSWTQDGIMPTWTRQFQVWNRKSRRVWHIVRGRQMSPNHDLHLISRVVDVACMCCLCSYWSGDYTHGIALTSKNRQLVVLVINNSL